MSTEDQARDLMMRHHHTAKNRQQAMLARTNEEVGLDTTDDGCTTIQGKIRSDVRASYDRSGASMS
jgi:hypothetical protein